MLTVGPAKKVTLHLNEDTAGSSDYIYNEVFALLYASGVSGATLVRPSRGFGSHHHIHSTHQARPGEERHMPVRIDFIESAERVEEILPKLAGLVTDGLIEVQDTTIYQIVKDGRSVS